MFEKSKTKYTQKGNPVLVKTQIFSLKLPLVEFLKAIFFFCCHLSFYGAVRCREPSVAFWCWKDSVQVSALPRDVCVTLLKLLLQNSIFSCENPLQMAFLWGSLRILWSKLCKRLCLLSMQWKTLPDICVLSFLFWWIRIPEFRKEATKSINSDS